MLHNLSLWPALNKVRVLTLCEKMRVLISTHGTCIPENVMNTQASDQ
jgi:hypothetical protein